MCAAAPLVWPCPAARATLQSPSSPETRNMNETPKKSAPVKARLPRGLADRGPADIAATEPDDGEDPRVLRALWLRGGRDAVHRIYRSARQIPARSGPAERGRVLVSGRRRAMAVAALRSDRAARALCRGKFRPAAETLSLLPRGLRVPQREAGAGALPPVHAIRRRYGRRRLASPPTPRCA